jgi:hypothetical protein
MLIAPTVSLSVLSSAHARKLTGWRPMCYHPFQVLIGPCYLFTLHVFAIPDHNILRFLENDCYDPR